MTETGCLPDGWRADLPDEHEWEHASRGGQSKEWDYWWQGEANPERANYDDTGIHDTSVVGSFPANGYGLYDVLGNVLEWTLTPDELKHGKNKIETRVVRGGWWFVSAGNLRCAYRVEAPPYSRGDFLGFRVVLRRSPV